MVRTTAELIVVYGVFSDCFCFKIGPLHGTLTGLELLEIHLPPLLSVDYRCVAPHFH